MEIILAILIVVNDFYNYSGPAKLESVVKKISFRSRGLAWGVLIDN